MNAPANPGAPAAPANNLAPPPGKPPRLYSDEDEDQPTRLYRPKPGDMPLPPRQKPPKKDP